jgi:hypothetical protein
VPDLLQKQDFVFNHRLWGDATGMHEIRGEQSGHEHGLKTGLPKENRKRIDNFRKIAAWRILKGNRIE